MFFQFYVLADSGPCSSFHDPVYKSNILETNSLCSVYVAFTLFLMHFMQEEAPLVDEEFRPDLVYVVYGTDPKLCPYRSSNKRQLLFGFDKAGKPFRTLGCDFL